MNLNKLTLAFLVFLASCEKQNPKQTWFCDYDEIMVLNGTVKQILVTSEPKDKNFYLGQFDEKGNLKYTIRKTELNWEDKDGKHSETTTDTLEYSSIYNETGEKTAITIKSPNDTSIAKWAFDSNGKVASFRTNITDPSSLNCMDYYKYDAQGDLSEYSKHFCQFRCPELYRYRYDKNHLLVGTSFYETCSGVDALIRSTSFEYKTFDTRKNWIKRVAHFKSFRGQTSTITEVREITYY